MRRTVLITGASSGIGKATALLLQREGFTVYGTTRQAGAIGNQEFAMPALDVGSVDSVQACFDAVLSKVGRLDVLIHNAGDALPGAAVDTTLAEVTAQLETNFSGVVRVVTPRCPPCSRRGRAGSSSSVRSPDTAPPFITCRTW